MPFHATARMRRLSLLALVILALALPVGAVVVPAGTPIHVRLQEPLSSAKAQSGQRFTGVLSEPLVVHGTTVAPRGSRVVGKVARATPSGRLTTPAELYLRLTAIDIHGKSYPVTTRLAGGKEKSHKRRNTIGIGGGTAAGALIGGIAGGGKGAGIGALAGAGAGTAGAYATGKKDIEYPVETPLTFHLEHAVNLP